MDAAPLYERERVTKEKWTREMFTYSVCLGGRSGIPLRVRIGEDMKNVKECKTDSSRLVWGTTTNGKVRNFG